MLWYCSVSVKLLYLQCVKLCACQMRCFANNWEKNSCISVSSEKKVTNDFCFVDEQVVMGNKLLVYIR